MTAALALIALIAAVEYQRRLSDAPSVMRSAVKTMSTAALALAAFLVGAPVLLVYALALGSVGDLALSRDGQRAFLAGLIAFAFSHLAYIPLFVGLPGTPVLFDLNWVAWAGCAAMVLLAISTTRWLLPHTGSLRVPVGIYVLIICVMGIAALHLGVDFRLSLIGAVLFLASDMILSVQLFRLENPSAASRRAGQCVWPLYWGGQALIALGIVKGLGLWVFAPA